jgi:HD-GYP domain-containing protein (c-di-GMP phosphodiesterase class II)
MTLYQDKISIHDLQIGMYVCRLDRSWLDTPFPFQGFFIRSRYEIKELKEFCQFVYIDAKRGSSPYKISKISQPSPLLARKIKSNKVKNLANFRYTYVNIGKYNKVKVPFRKEIRKAKELMADLSSSMEQINFNIRTGSKMNFAKTADITTEIVKSVIRNPDSLISLSRLREKGDYTYNHSLRCCILAAAFGRYLGLEEKDLITLTTGLLFADIGKTKLKRNLLNEQGEPSISNKLLYNSHVELGVEILANNKDISHEVLVIAENHHERYDGSGYPYALQGEEIPYFGQVAGLIDVFDAITNKKSYGNHMNTAQAMDWIYTQRDKLFSSQLVDDFIQAIGLYPPGTKVKLTDNSEAIVISQNPEKRLRPVVYLIENSEQEKLEKYKKIDLSKKRMFSKKVMPMIARALL